MSINKSYDDFINELLALPTREFAPFAMYDADGDSIEFFMKRDPYFGERVDGSLTVFRSRDTNEIVGALVERVSVLCKTILGILPGFKVEGCGGKLPLVHIFRARLWSLRAEEDKIVQIYRFLAEKAEEHKAEVKAEVEPASVKSAPIAPKLGLWSLFAKSA